MNHVERAHFYAIQRGARVGHRGCDGPRLAPALPPGVRARQPVRSASDHCPTSQGFPPAAARALRFRGPGGSVGANRLAAARFAALQPATPAQGGGTGQQNCPPGQLATWVSRPGHPPELVCQSKLKTNEPTVNTLGGIHKKCPTGQLWTCKTIGGIEFCACASPSISAADIKDTFPDTVPVPALSKGAGGTGPVPQGDAGGAQNCPPGQIARWVSVAGHPPTLQCGPPPLANVNEKNKPQGAQGSPCGAACPAGQVCVCVTLGGNQHCFCAASKADKHNTNTGTSNPAGRGARFAGCPCP